MKNNKNRHKVAIIMGSQSDYSTLKYCEKVLKILKINFEKKIISAHRTPKRMFDFARNAEKDNVSVIIAGAGGSAHLPGMVAAITRIPVVGVPLPIISYGGSSMLAIMISFGIIERINLSRRLN